MTKRIITQIVDNDGDICALCNDGTVWFWSAGSRAWKPWMAKIPQDEASDPDPVVTAAHDLLAALERLVDPYGGEYDDVRAASELIAKVKGIAQ